MLRKLIVLDNGWTPIKEIEGKISSGSINIDGNSSIENL